MSAPTKRTVPRWTNEELKALINELIVVGVREGDFAKVSYWTVRKKNLPPCLATRSVGALKQKAQELLRGFPEDMQLSYLVNICTALGTVQSTSGGDTSAPVVGPVSGAPSASTNRMEILSSVVHVTLDSPLYVWSSVCSRC